MQYRQKCLAQLGDQPEALAGREVKNALGLCFFSCGPIIKQTSTIFRLELKMEGVYDDE